MNVEIASRLASMRREKGLSQEELAAQLGVSRQAVSKWERGEAAPDMGNLVALADLYEVTLDALVRGEEGSTAASASRSLPGCAGELPQPSASTPALGEAAAPQGDPGHVAPDDAGCAAPAAAAQPGASAYAPPSPSRGAWRSFPYPVACALLYLLTGCLFGWWHPGWLIFLTIPLYYWVARIVEDDPNYRAEHDGRR